MKSRILALAECRGIEKRYWSIQPWLYGGDRDIEYKYACAKVVRIRYAQHCPSAYHEGGQLKPGTLAVVETAWCSDFDRFGSCYTCISCIEKAEAELHISKTAGIGEAGGS